MSSCSSVIDNELGSNPPKSSVLIRNDDFKLRETNRKSAFAVAAFEAMLVVRNSFKRQ